ncbi:MAG TPA: response regulator transcription factor, partial [Acidimicrobiia bacterium]|nr:response regulator transcription factor [Acidimicrobiia bacterium]
IARAHELWARLTVVTYNRASVLSSYPDHESCQRVLDEVEQLVREHGTVRMIVAARTLRSVDLCALGRLDEARAALDSFDTATIDGIGRGVLECARALIALHAGDYDGALVEVRAPEAGGGTDAARCTERSVLRASALAWRGELVPARAVVVDALRLLDGRIEAYWHGWLALAGMRIEADAAAAGPPGVDVDLPRVEALERALAIADSWARIRAGRDAPFPLADAFTAGIAAELGRITGEDPAARAGEAARAFATVSIPYHELYFRWREGAALVDAGDRPRATRILGDARRRAGDCGYGGIVAVIDSTARAAQLRMGPGRTTVDGDEALSVRELEVLRLVAEGRSNPEIADALCVSRRTARAHVSHILEKLQVGSRTEAVAVAHRRGIV